MFGPPSSPSHGLPPSAWPQTPVASPLRFGTAQQPSYLFTFSPGAEAPPFVAVSPVPGPRPGSKSHGQLGSAATLNADEDMNGDVHYMDADVQGADPRKHFAASLDALGSHKRQRLDPYNSNVMHDRDAPMTLPLTESRASCVMTDADNANMGLPPLLAADSTMTCAESDAELEHASMKQFKATEELLITERTYVSDLEMLIDLVQEIMELKKLFANFLANYPDPRPLIKDLWRLHHSLLRDFQMSDGDPQKMCEAILNRLNEFSSYDAYIAILPPFRAAFDAALRDPKVEQQLAQKVRYAGDQAGLKPSEWLPKPFHRLTRLSMLCQVSYLRLIRAQTCNQHEFFFFSRKSPMFARRLPKDSRQREMP